MRIIDRLSNISDNNKNLLINIIGTVLIKGGGMAVGILSLPLYMRYFPDNAILGVWFTILNILSWVLNFDLGIGNGLRNHLTIAISENNLSRAKELISSAYVMLGVVMVIICAIFYTFSAKVDWNSFFNISSTQISSGTLEQCVNISMLGILLSFFLRIIMSILYAMQKAAIPNLLTLITNLLIVIYLLIIPSTGNIDIDFERLSIYHAVVLNIPLIMATIFVFYGDKMRALIPNIRFYRHKAARAVLSLGVMFLLIQLLYMIISTTNEWFISQFYAPEYCVDYQMYNKVFTMLGSLFMIALTPIWSAITKAYTENNFHWLNKLKNILYATFGVFVLFQISILPFLQDLFNIWLGDKAPMVDYTTAWIFVLYGITFAWVAVQSTFASGFGNLKIQFITYIIAALIKVVGIVMLSRVFSSWNCVIVATIVGLIPFCVLQFVHTNRKMRLKEI